MFSMAHGNAPPTVHCCSKKAIKKFGEGDGSGGREKNFGKGTAGRKEKTYLYDAIARVLKSEIRVLKF